MNPFVTPGATSPINRRMIPVQRWRARQGRGAPPPSRLQRRLVTLVSCILLLAPIPAMQGCRGNFGDSTEMTPTPELGGNREVRFYLYPPTGLGVPSQATAALTVETGTFGVVPVDPGIIVEGALTLVADTGDNTQLVPVSGEVVALDPASGLSYKEVADNEASTFSLNLPEGVFDLQITWDGFGLPFPPQYLADIEINARSEELFFLGPLDEGGDVKVLVQDSAGVPIEGATVYCIDASTGARSSLTLSVDEVTPGETELRVLHGPQELWVGPSASNTQLAHQKLGDIGVSDQPLEPLTYTVPLMPSSLAGKVIDALNAPVADVSILITRRSNGLEGSFSATFSTRADGSYQIPVPAGDYDVVFRPTTAPADGGTQLSGLRVEGLSATVDYPLVLADVVLSPARTVTGMILASDGSAVEGASVYFSSSDRANPGRGALTDAAGAYQLELGLGAYMLEVTPPQFSGLAYGVVPVVVGSDSATVPELRLERGIEVGYRFELEGTPLQGLVVDVRQVPDDISTIWSPENRLASGVTDEEGVLELVLPLSSSTTQAGSTGEFTAKSMQ